MSSKLKQPTCDSAWPHVLKMVVQCACTLRVSGVNFRQPCALPAKSWSTLGGAIIARKDGMTLRGGRGEGELLGNMP